MLEERRQQIAQGLANAEKIKAELDRTEAQRQEVMAQAHTQAAKFIEEARAAAARVLEQETQKAIAAAEQIMIKAREAAAQDHDRMLAELKREVGRLVVQATTDGDRQDSDAGRSAAPGRGDRQAGGGVAMKSNKQAKREAKQLFRFCLVNGLLDENRVRQVVRARRRRRSPGLPGHPGAFSAVGETRLRPAHGHHRERHAACRRICRPPSRPV